jgi:hypothetical protein
LGRSRGGGGCWLFGQPGTTPAQALQLTAGAETASALPFSGLNYRSSVVVDSNGDVYLGDGENHRVLKLPVR